MAVATAQQPASGKSNYSSSSSLGSSSSSLQKGSFMHMFTVAAFHRSLLEYKKRSNSMCQGLMLFRLSSKISLYYEMHIIWAVYFFVVTTVGKRTVKKKKKSERPSFQIICKIIYFVNIATKHYLNTKFSKYLQVLGQYESAKYLTSSRQGPS